MNHPKASLLLFLALNLVALSPANAIVIPTVPVGNANNANDPESFNIGGVEYNYRIGTYEVTVAQYTAFLNAVAKTDTYGLYNPAMATDLIVSRISRVGVSGNYSYSALGRPNQPVTHVDWADAARFANWLHNGQPTGAQVASTTENGAYSLNGATTNEAFSAVSRNAGATWFIPSVDEWYKAAYYQPASQGGDADNYWRYATRTNNDPNSDQPPGRPSIRTNVGNFQHDDGLINGFNDGLAVTGSMDFNPSQNYLTNVGAYTFAPGPYGTFDQVGNVSEWTEDAAGPYRGLFGGSWASPLHDVQSSSGFYNLALVEDASFGFRVATVPEPSTLALAGLGLLIAARRRR